MKIEKGIEEIVGKSPLFQGIKGEDIASMMDCLSARQEHFSKGETILSEGDKLQEFAMLIRGSIIVEREDYWGNRSIMQRVEAPDIFGEAYATPGSEPLLYYVIAAEDTDVLFLDCNHLLTRLIQNLFVIIAEKNRRLTGKLRHMSKRTTRDKLLSYLSEVHDRVGSQVFDIPFNRQQLADFLSVDRSALSSELSKMQKEGLIRYNKSTFELLRTE